MEMKDYLTRVLRQERLSREETKDILTGITRDAYPAEQITALLTAIQMRGVTVDELLGFRDGILETGVEAPLDCDRYIDVVGTGGDRKNTFNISTTACFVIALPATSTPSTVRSTRQASSISMPSSSPRP